MEGKILFSRFGRLQDAIGVKLLPHLLIILEGRLVQ